MLVKDCTLQTTWFESIFFPFAFQTQFRTNAVCISNQREKKLETAILQLSLSKFWSEEQTETKFFHFDPVLSDPFEVGGNSRLMCNKSIDIK